MTMHSCVEYSVKLTELLGRQMNEAESKYAPDKLFVRGPMKLPLRRPRVSVIGTRKPTEKGITDARKITQVLVGKNVLIVSGLAAGIDTVAHRTAIDRKGWTVAVLGTPLNRSYPRQNAGLQEETASSHMVISQFPAERPVTRKNFVIRNKTMALISDATIIVEAGDASGSLHHGRETIRLGRSLFMTKAVASDQRLSWPQEMIRYGAMVLSDPSDVFDFLPSGRPTSNIFSQVSRCGSPKCGSPKCACLLPFIRPEPATRGATTVPRT